MAGTRIGGQRAAATNVDRYGADFYKRIGSIGGTKGRDGGFGSLEVGKDGLTGRERARKYGAIGGKMSKRGKR